MDEGQRMHASIKEEVSESGKGPIPPLKKRDYMGENISTTPDFTEKVHHWVTGVRPQWSSDQLRGVPSHRVRRLGA